MTFEQIIQQVGKEIELNVLYEENGVASVIGYDDIKRAKITFNCGLTGSVMNGIELELYTALPDVPITLSVTAKFGEDTATKLYQNYHFKEAPTYNADSKTYTHILYDEMINLMVEYQPITINYPTTLIQFFQRLVTELNLTTNISSLPNGNRTIAQDPYTGINYTYRDALDDIGQATGTLFKVDNTEIIKCNLGTTAKVVDDDILKNQNISMGKHFGPINVIVLSRAGGSDNIYYPSTLPENPIEYKITDNILMNDNNRADYLQELYSALYGIEYDIYDCQLVGYGGFEPLDKVQIRTYEGQELKSYNSYVFNNEIVMNGGGYEESIYTEMPEETNTEYQYADTTDRRINQTYLIVDKQNQSITSVISQVNGQNTKLNTMQDTIDGIEREISNISGMTMTKEGYGSITFDDMTTASNPINIQIKPTSESICNIYPNFSLYPTTQEYPAKEGLVPSNSLTPSNSLVPSTGYPAQHIIYPRQIKILFHNITENQDIYYPLPYDLLYYDETHYDEFYFDLNSETCYVKKRCKFNADGTIGLLPSEQTLNINPFPEIELTEGKYTISLPGFSGYWIHGELVAKNLYTDQFYTKVETRSRIAASATDINLSVDEKLSNYSTTEQMHSELDITSRQITSSVSETYATKDTTNTLSSRIAQTAKSIVLSVNNGSTSSGITITTTKEDGSTSSQSGTIEMTGLVKFTDLSGTGTTTINGANIKTGTIDASQVSVTNISADNITAGTFSAASISLKNVSFTPSSSSIAGWNINSNYLSGSGSHDVSIYKDGRASFGNNYGWINTGSAGTWIQGNSRSYPCYVLDKFSRPSMDGQTSIRIHAEEGSIYISNNTSYGSSSGTGGNSKTHSDIELAANNGSTRIYNKINNWIRAGYYNILEGGSSGGVVIGCSGGGINIGRASSTFGFSAAGSVEIGGPNTSVYIKGNPYGGSSRNMKKDIKLLTSDELNKIYDAYKEQNVYSFKYKKGFNDDIKKKRYGFILDEMEDTILKETLDIQDIDDKETKNYNPEYLSRTNFIVIKMLQDKIDALQKEIEELKK